MKILAILVAATVAMVSISEVSQGAVAYKEKFIWDGINPNGSSNVSISNVGWKANQYNGYDYNLQFGVNAIAVTKDTDANIGSQTAVNSNPYTGTGAINARTFMNGTQSASPVLLWTSEYSVDRSANEVDSISFSQRNNSSSDKMRAAVQIGGNWYATTLSQTATSSFTTLSFLFLPTVVGAWTNVNFTASTYTGTFIPSANGTLSLGLAPLTTALPAGNITAFGTFSDSATAIQRTDDFTINASPIPEPTGLAVMGIAGAITLRRRRRQM